MTPGGLVTARLDDLSRLTRRQWVLRLVPPAATVVFVLLADRAGPGLSALETAAALVLCALVVLVPDSGAGLALLLLLLLLWLWNVPGSLGVATLLAGVDLTVLHVAVALASYNPPGVDLDRRFLLTWARRGLLLAAAALLVWLAARGATAWNRSPAGWAMAAGLLAVLVWTAFLGLRLAAERDEQRQVP